MLRFVAVLSLVACAKAGAPIGYGGAIASYGGPGLAQYGSPYGAYGSPAFGAYAARPVAHAVAAPVIRAGPVGYAPAHYAPQYAAAPVQAIHAAPVLRQQVAVAQPIVQKAVAVRQEPFDPHPQYNFGYSVSDQLTGDQHSHTESRDGGVVQGQYSLVEPDGAIRTVTYTSDPVNGFNAVVDRQRPQVAVQKVAAPVAFAQRPIAVAQPVRAVAHVTPAVTAVHAGAPYGYAQQAIAGPGYYHH